MEDPLPIVQLVCILSLCQDLASACHKLQIFLLHAPQLSAMHRSFTAGIQGPCDKQVIVVKRSLSSEVTILKTKPALLFCPTPQKMGKGYIYCMLSIVCPVLSNRKKLQVLCTYLRQQ